jgi:hypothetical protein
MRRLAFLCALGFSAGIASRAHADPASTEASVDAARAAFEKGAKLAAEERWLDALGEFETSAKLRPHATTTYDIGYCLRALGRATEARKYFRKALAQDIGAGGNELTAELRASATRYIEDAKEKIATPLIAIDPPDATVTVDGRPLEAAEEGHYLAGTRPPGPGETVTKPAGFVIELDAGPHEIVVAAPDGRSKVVHELFLPGSVQTVRIEVPPTPPPAPVVPPSTARRTWGFVLGGVGIASLGVGTFFGLRARALWNDAKGACPDRTHCPNDDASRLSTDAKTAGNLSTIALVVGGGAVLGGTILILTAPSGEPTALVSASIDRSGGGRLSLVGEF